MSATLRRLQSRDNPLLQRVRKLLHDPVAYRKLGQCWLEGEHLGLALLGRGRRAAQALFSESAWARHAAGALSAVADDCVVLPDQLMADLSSLPSPAGIGFLMDLPAAQAPQPGLSTVVLDRLQDAGNVGSILRSAAALGVQQVLALKGTAGLWSAKVLRAGMGAQFGLHLIEACEPADLQALRLPLIVTDSHAAAAVHQAAWPEPCAWVFGHEGHGVCPEIRAEAHVSVRIPQPGGEESLNVAAAAAICLYESLRRR